MLSGLWTASDRHLGSPDDGQTKGTLISFPFLSSHGLTYEGDDS